MSTAAQLADTLFVTGRLAEPALRNIASELDIDHQIAVMNISVAALMTTRWIARRLKVPGGVDSIVIPGLCDGDVETLQQATGLPVRKGPADVRALPEWYGREAVRAALGPRDVRVFAEINGVQSLSHEQVIDRAEAYRAEGADVIDLGLSLDRSWLAEGPPTIAALRERGLSLSIDTLDPEHIRMADAAGVDYVLSLTPDTIEIARDLHATPVLIANEPEDVAALDRMASLMEQLDRPYLLDSILAPINSGFAASLARYVEVRRRHPQAEMLMGIGNLTELTEADSTGVTALLIGFCQEVGIGAVLTTEVIGWARGAVRETVLAAQIMHLAERQARPPKHIDPGLVTSKDESMRAPSEDELRAMQAEISDANYRLFADAEWLYAFNGERFVRDANMYAVFDQLGVSDASHAFYLGKELMKATIARGLRKSYRQEGPLDWGLLSFPEPRREDIR
jgi:dihydropteroate synthase